MYTLPLRKHLHIYSIFVKFFDFSSCILLLRETNHNRVIQIGRTLLIGGMDVRIRIAIKHMIKRCLKDVIHQMTPGAEEMAQKPLTLSWVVMKLSGIDSKLSRDVQRKTLIQLGMLSWPLLDDIVGELAKAKQLLQVWQKQPAWQNEKPALKRVCCLWAIQQHEGHS